MPMPVERKKATQKSPSLHLLITFPAEKKQPKHLSTKNLPNPNNKHKKDHLPPMIWAKIDIKIL